MNSMFLGATSFRQRLCGSAWVHSKASTNLMFQGSPGSISRTGCKHQHVTRRPIPIILPIKRDLVGKVVPGTMKCPKCGTFQKSGRVSCCAPGGAWFKNCGGLGNRNVDHRWSEGVKACKSTTTTTIRSVCPKCGSTKKSGRTSCCGHGGSWFGDCRNPGNTKFHHTWYKGIQSCKTRSQLKKSSGQESHAAQVLNSHNVVAMGNSSKAVATATQTFTHTPVDTSTPMPNTTPIITSAETSIHTPTTTSAKIISTSSNMTITTMTPRTPNTNTATTMSITAPAHTRTLTTVAITTAVTTTPTMITRTATDVTTEWIVQDSVTVGIIFSCTTLLILIILMAMVYCFTRKNMTDKKRSTTGVVLS